MSNALVAELVPPAALGKSLALSSATGWIDGVIGFGTAGYAMQNLGSGPTCLIGGFLALAAIGLLLPIRAAVSPTG
jgi:hypothetical protein